MKRTVTAVVVALVASAAPIASAHAHSAAAAPAATSLAGSYVALPSQVRVVDTRTGTGAIPKRALRAGRDVVAKVTGRGRVPSTGVGSLVVTVTAVSPTAAGGLVVYPNSTARPGVTTVQFPTAKRSVTTTTVVRPSRTGRIRIHDYQAKGSVHVTIDVSGYYRSGRASSSEPGVFHSVTPRRLADTRTGSGAKLGRVGPHRSVSVALGKRGGLPAAPGAVAATITALRPSAGGTFTAGRPDERTDAAGYPLAHFAARESTSGFTALRVADGTAYITNNSGGTVDFVVDVVGYWTLGFAEKAHTFQTRVQTRVLSSSTVPAHRSKAVRLGGSGGVERSGVGAAVVTLHASSPAASGGLQAWRTGSSRASAPTVLQFAKGRTSTNVAVVPTTDDGRVSIRNTSSRAVRIYVEIDGYVPSRDASPVRGSATARYLDGLVGTLDTDSATMAGYGRADGAAGHQWILLDVGAQSVTTPVLSKAHPGVSVAKTAKRVAYTYSDLVTLIRSYLTALGEALPTGVAPPVVAVGTNNDGEWDKTKKDYYAPADRGRDWADDVIEQLTGFGADVKGANDIEAGFASTQTQALEWEKAYLNAAAVQAPSLYFNGSADGCPITWTSGVCSYGWTPQDYAALAGQPGVVAVPQIYIGSQATQWAELSRASGHKITFAGMLSEYTLNPDFLSPRQAAAAFTRALASVGTTRRPAFVADFQQP